MSMMRVKMNQPNRTRHTKRQPNNVPNPPLKVVVLLAHGLGRLFGTSLAANGRESGRNMMGKGRGS